MPSIKQTGPYIPRADGAFRDWLNNFAVVVAAAPSALGLTAADATMFIELAQRYGAAYVRATAPGTRTRVTVSAKNVVRREAWSIARPTAMRIKRNCGISDSQKINLGIHPPHRSQSPIPRPRHAPSLAIVGTANAMHTLRYSDPANPSRWAKPPGVTQMQFAVAVGNRPARKPGGKCTVHTRTRHVFNVPFEPQECGKTATYFGRWVTEKGLTGPWSSPVLMTITGAGETRPAALAMAA